MTLHIGICFCYEIHHFIVVFRRKRALRNNSNYLLFIAKDVCKTPQNQLLFPISYSQLPVGKIQLTYLIKKLSNRGLPLTKLNDVLEVTADATHTSGLMTAQVRTGIFQFNEIYLELPFPELRNKSVVYVVGISTQSVCLSLIWTAL